MCLHRSEFKYTEYRLIAYEPRLHYVAISQTVRVRHLLLTLVVVFIRPPLRTPVSSDCDAAKNYNQGCGTSFKNPNSYGTRFNTEHGGWFVMERSRNRGISVWFWSRTDHNVPFSVKECSNTLSPDGSWGEPEAYFPTDTCDYNTHFDDHRIIFDITLCVSTTLLQLFPHRSPVLIIIFRVIGQVEHSRQQDVVMSRVNTVSSQDAHYFHRFLLLLRLQSSIIIPRHSQKHIGKSTHSVYIPDDHHFDSKNLVLGTNAFPIILEDVLVCSAFPFLSRP
jgi:hypothetical protein